MTLCSGGKARAVCRDCRAEGPAVPADRWREAKIMARAQGWELGVVRHRRFTHFLCPACISVRDQGAG